MMCCYIESSHTVVACIYRPPDADSSCFTSLLETLQQKIDDISTNNRMPDLYILGDFNFPEFDWKTFLSPSTPSGRVFLDFVDRNLLTQVVKETTRGENTLDLILTNNPRYIVEVCVKSTILSDHSIVKALLGYDLLGSSLSFPLLAMTLTHLELLTTIMQTLMP